MAPWICSRDSVGKFLPDRLRSGAIPILVDDRRQRDTIAPRTVQLYAGQTLAPVPFYQHPAASLVNPVMRYPVGTPPWWLLPPSRVPGVCVAIPAMVPGHPHMVATRSRPPPLDDHMRWPNADKYVGRRGAEHQRTCKNQSDQSLNHILTTLRAVSRARGWPPCEPN